MSTGACCWLSSQRCRLPACMWMLLAVSSSLILELSSSLSACSKRSSLSRLHTSVCLCVLASCMEASHFNYLRELPSFAGKPSAPVWSMY